MTTIRVQREGSQTVDEIQWQAQELNIVERSNGPAVAALIAAGIGVLVLGILTTWGAASTSFANDVLNIKNRVGPLSGKTTFAVLAYLVSWAVLSIPLWKKNISLNTALLITAALVAAGFVGTFPKFFQAFE
jgi:hypothetical protein